MAMTLEVENLHADYRGREVLKGINLVARDGEVLSVVGPNGAGKSTLLRCIAGIIKPRRGSIRYNGINLASLSERKRAKIVGYLPQYIPVVFPLTVYEAILLGRIHNFNIKPSRRDVDVVEEVIKEFRLDGMKHRYLNELSGGERQRVHLARLFAQDPHIMLLDEPEANLDVRYQLEILGRVREWVKTTGKIAVMAIHDLNLAIKFSDRVVVLNGGRIVAEGSPGEVLDPELIERVYGAKLEVFQTPYGPRVVV